ncbi:MAG: cation:proton antiporter [bacterium]|nr:cation:proton antiporter [bacterium]
MQTHGPMAFARWLAGAAAVIGAVALIILRPFPFLFYPDLPHVAFFGRCMYVLLLCCVLCIFRIMRGPTAPDRAVAIDILGIVIVGFCAVLCIPTGRNWYIDVGIAWALQSFIATLALAKYLEGRSLDA